jgi:uncharacterized protein (TIGR02246 family)
MAIRRRLKMSVDEQAIREVVASWMAASQSGDLDTVLSLMSDDVVFMVPGREPFGKEAFAAQSRALAQGGAKMQGESEIVELQVQGDWAWLRNRLRISVTPPGQAPLRHAGYTLTILRKNAQGRWQLVRDANLLA